jgi:hypothetical protein
MIILGKIISLILAFAITAWIGWIAVSALQSGVAYIAGGKGYKKKTRPVAYWVVVSVQVCFTLFFLAFAIKRLMSI